MILLLIAVLAIVVMPPPLAPCERDGAESAQPNDSRVAAALDEEVCNWRQCDHEEGSLHCTGRGFCDMLRNQCVPTCTAENCCSGVNCPSGSGCVPGLGSCGTPAGSACFDLGTSWWTGRDASSAPGGVPTFTPAVVFDIRNAGKTPLFFESTQTQPVRIDIYVRSCGSERRLELSENHYCPCRCPEHGPPVCRDCGPPTPTIYRLPPGSRLTTIWSGTEEVGMWRICGAPPATSCLIRRVTLPGAYSVEVCANSSVRGGEPDAQDANRLLMATPSGLRDCRRVHFVHPLSSPVVIRFGIDRESGQSIDTSSQRATFNLCRHARLKLQIAERESSRFIVRTIKKGETHNSQTKARSFRSTPEHCGPAPILTCKELFGVNCLQ